MCVVVYNADGDAGASLPFAPSLYDAVVSAVYVALGALFGSLSQRLPAVAPVAAISE